MSVTSPAVAGAAPATVVAHLSRLVKAMKAHLYLGIALASGGCATVDPVSSWVMVAPGSESAPKEFVGFLSKVSTEWNRALIRTRASIEPGIAVSLIVVMGGDGKLKVDRIEGVTDGAQKEGVMAAVLGVQEVTQKFSMSADQFSNVAPSGEWRLSFNYVE